MLTCHPSPSPKHLYMERTLYQLNYQCPSNHYILTVLLYLNWCNFSCPGISQSKCTVTEKMLISQICVFCKASLFKSNRYAHRPETRREERQQLEKIESGNWAFEREWTLTCSFFPWGLQNQYDSHRRLWPSLKEQNEIFSN